MHAMTASRFYCGLCIQLTLQFYYDSTLEVLQSRRHLVSTSSTKFVTWLALYYRQYGGTRIWECNHGDTFFRPYMNRFYAGRGLIRKRKVQCSALWSSFESQNSFSDLKILGFMRVYFVNFCSTLNTRIIRYQHNFVEPWPERSALNLPLSNETSSSPKFAHIRTKNVSPQNPCFGHIMWVLQRVALPVSTPLIFKIKDFTN